MAFPMKYTPFWNRWVPAASSRLRTPTSRKFGDTPCTKHVSCRGIHCTASESLMTWWQWARVTTWLSRFSICCLNWPMPSSRLA